MSSEISLSSATIPDDLTMSCVSVFETLANNVEEEKETLLTRLRELMLSEESQVDKNLNDCKTKVAQLEAEYLKSISDLKHEAALEEQELMAIQQQEVNALKKAHADEEQRIEFEIRKLEAELESILAPVRLLASLRNSSPEEKNVIIEQRNNAKLSELEQELQCCSCMQICCPPIMIYQCPEGDLICQHCKDQVTTCPGCNISLNNQLLSRNKVLENIARKYL